MSDTSGFASKTVPLEAQAQEFKAKRGWDESDVQALGIEFLNAEDTKSRVPNYKHPEPCAVYPETCFLTGRQVWSARRFNVTGSDKYIKQFNADKSVEGVVAVSYNYNSSHRQHVLAEGAFSAYDGAKAAQAEGLSVNVFGIGGAYGWSAHREEGAPRVLKDSLKAAIKAGDVVYVAFDNDQGTRYKLPVEKELLKLVAELKAHGAEVYDLALGQHSRVSGQKVALDDVLKFMSLEEVLYRRQPPPLKISSFNAQLELTHNMLWHAVTDPSMTADEKTQAVNAAHKALNVPTMMEAWDNSAYGKDGFVYRVRKGNHHAIAAKVDFVANIEEQFGKFADYAALSALVTAANTSSTSKAEKVFAATKKAIVSNLTERLKMEKSVTSTSITVDMFTGKECCFDQSEQSLKIIYRHRELSANSFVSRKTAERVLADYRQHFEQFDDLLDMLVAARFAQNRRKAYLWLHAHSSFGKGMLQSVLGNLGVACDVSNDQIQNIVSGKPVGIDAVRMTRTFAMICDEFKYAASSIKHLDSSVQVNVKYMPEVTVPLYLKLFLSAEGVLSMTGGGVEPQFNNRFSYMTTSNKTLIEDRPLAKEMGMSQYVPALTVAVGDAINARVRQYQALGPWDSASRAEKKLDELHERYKLSNTHEMTESTEEDIADTAIKLIRLIVEAKTKGAKEIASADCVDKLQHMVATGWWNVVGTRAQRVHVIAVKDLSTFVNAVLQDQRMTKAVNSKFSYKIDSIAQIVYDKCKVAKPEMLAHYPLTSKLVGSIPKHKANLHESPTDNERAQSRWILLDPKRVNGGG